MVERQFNTKLKNVQTDWGGEFRNLSTYFTSLGIVHRRSCPHTSEQNGIVERRHRHVVETGLALLAQSHVPQRFWHYAFDTAVYLINRMPSTSSSLTSPYEPAPASPEEPTAPSDPAPTTVVASSMPITSEPSNLSSTTTSAAPPSTQPSTTRPRPSNLRPNPKQTERYNPSAFQTTTTPTDPVSSPFLPPPTTEPRSFTVANKHIEWRRAMVEEFSALTSNGTWSLVPPVSGANIVDCRWVYRIKRNKTGAPYRYKARLVAKGFTQTPDVDYKETFSPVVKATTIRVVLSLVVSRQWALRQLDVQNAFLKGNLEETIYLKQPQGFVDSTKPDYVCKLHKSLYGLKQAPRVWFTRFSSAMHRLGFTGSKTDPSLFIYHRQATVLYLLVYVDDIILTGNNTAAINFVISQLSSELSLKDMGDLDYFLGLEIIKRDKDILLSQQKYILDILDRAGLSSAKSVPSPMTSSTVLMPDDSPKFSDPAKYRQIVGALQYATLSRPDISFAVNRVCQFMHSPTEHHWSAVKRILRYLLGTSHLGLLIRQNSGSTLHAFADTSWNHLAAFSDADWAGCPVDRRSTGGFAIYLGCNLVSWMARKQKTVSRSSTESEYKAIGDAVVEILWLESLMRELGFVSDSPPVLWCDNLGATYLSSNPVFHARTKHVEIDYHFVREKVAQGGLRVRFIHTDQGNDGKKPLLHLSLYEGSFCDFIGGTVRWNPSNQDEIAYTSSSMHNDELTIFDIEYTRANQVLRKRPPVRVYLSHGFSDIAFFNDGERILASDTSGAISMWDRRESDFPQRVLTTKKSIGSFASIQLLGDQCVYGATKGGLIFIWDLRRLRAGRTAACQSDKEVHSSPLTTIDLESMLQAQGHVRPMIIHSININPSCPYQLGFHIGDGWSGVLDMHNLLVSHVHSPPSPPLLDRWYTKSFTVVPPRKPSWLNEHSIYVAASASSNGLHLIDFYPHPSSPCHVDYEGSRSPGEGVERKQSVFVPLSKRATVCATHPINGTIVAGTMNASLLVISQKSLCKKGDGDDNDDGHS
ncbi:hypothetical protein SSX86_018687 [Deinandra increscens subsp. villosa]|uniref:Integrase catalytic domain-containing protein n=1 Tax=Deinandra increscens subsp. villosa TaxID=3103831 RepID=A0AAP0CW01_9ASTR